MRRVVESFHPLRIILFGSATRGEFNPDSDVDLLVVMPEGTRRLAAARTPDEKNTIQCRTDATDAEIDRLVYELYGLTEDEIRTVEGAGESPRSLEPRNNDEDEGHVDCATGAGVVLDGFGARAG